MALFTVNPASLHKAFFSVPMTLAIFVTIYKLKGEECFSWGFDKIPLTRNPRLSLTTLNIYIMDFWTILFSRGVVLSLLINPLMDIPYVIFVSLLCSSQSSQVEKINPEF